MSIQPGEPFPAFSATAHDGTQVDLAAYRGGDNLVVFFYPRATTRGCVRETTEFGQREADFAALGTKLVGVSVDDPALQQEHAIQCATTFPLLSDTGAALSTRLGILNDRGMAKRTTYLLDGSGTVRQVFADVTVDGHVDAVLAAAAQMPR
jgi:peroxiredoxin Q/BCP